jgi:hypothetical protein
MSLLRAFRLDSESKILVYSSPRHAVFRGRVPVVSGLVYNINQVSLRQAITAHRLPGRMNATMKFLTVDATPVGGLHRSRRGFGLLAGGCDHRGRLVVTVGAD